MKCSELSFCVEIGLGKCHAIRWGVAVSHVDGAMICCFLPNVIMYFIQVRIMYFMLCQDSGR